MAQASEVLKPGQRIKPIVNPANIVTLVENLYGFNCSSIVQLPGYDDVNYKVATRDGDAVREYVFKVVNALDSKKRHLMDAQCALLLHLRSNGIPCQKPLKNRMGHYYSVEKLESGEHVVRLLEFLPGCTLQQVPTSPSLLFEAGRCVAKLDVAAKTFRHPGYDNYKSIWLLDELPHSSKFLYAMKDVIKKETIEKVIAVFTKRVIPLKDKLEKGLIHGDFNENNVVVQEINGKWNITGVLDFGDSHFNCYVFELAIAIVYMMIVHKSLDAAGYVIAGYSTVRKPTQQEFSLLKICVAARLSQSLINGAYSILQDPENTYITVSAPAAWKLLAELWPLNEEELLDRWKTIADNYVDKS